MTCLAEGLRITVGYFRESLCKLPVLLAP